MTGVSIPDGEGKTLANLASDTLKKTVSIPDGEGKAEMLGEAYKNCTAYQSPMGKV